jgi:hypothetical protein
VTEEPSDAPGETAGGNRSEQPAEQGPEHAACDEYRDQHKWQQIAQTSAMFPLYIRRRQRLAVDDGNHLPDPCFNAAVIVAQLEMRRDGLVDDAIRDRIGQRAFQSVADLDAHTAVVFRNQQDRAVVDPLAPQFPLVGHADAVLLDFFGLRRRHHQHGNLAALLRLELRKPGLDLIDRPARQGTREVHDAGRERRDGDIGARRHRGEARHHACREPEH